MSIEAIVGKTCQAATEPFCPRYIPFEDFVPRLKPVKFLRDPGPELFGLLHRLPVDCFVLLERFDVRRLRKAGGRFELAIFVQYGINGSISCHVVSGSSLVPCEFYNCERETNILLERYTTSPQNGTILVRSRSFRSQAGFGAHQQLVELVLAARFVTEEGAEDHTQKPER